MLRHLNVDISGKCNLRCLMCSFQDGFPEQGLMAFATFKKLKAALGTLQSLSLQCNAEPLLNNRIAEYVAFAKGINKDIKVLFVTNGMLLGPAMISRLLAVKPDGLYISVDGATKNTYETIRKGARFERVIKNIEELARQKKASGSNFLEIGMVTVANKLNVAELPDILDLAITLGVDSMFVNGLDIYSDEMKGNELYARSRETVNTDYGKVFAGMKDTALKHGIKLDLPHLSAVPYRTCKLNSCVVNWNGEVSPCALLSYKRSYWYFGEKHVHPKVVFGNIKKQNIFDIWGSKGFLSFRNDLQKGKLPYYCRACLWQHKVLC
ncbi:MAG: SPASM domain-containing protein [Candidatus Omnitrophica bacterium]|nr:SPASM domain-containing protein [Candidatus Omnitrophota bacterium]